VKTDIRKHLLGVYSSLRARIDLINSSIGHAGTQGGETENDIKSLFADFLPSNYGLGSGVIIDINGNTTKQIDIIVFDKNRADYTLSASSKIFLADHVIAAIEIKTTYSTGKDSSLEQALNNIASVKKMQVAKHDWIESQFNPSNGQFEFIKYTPSPPLGIIFFFRGRDTNSALDLDRFFIKMKDAVDKVPLELQPDFLFSLDHAAFFRHTDIGSKTASTQQYSVALVQAGDDNSKVLNLTGITTETKAIVDFSQLTFSDGEKFHGVQLDNIQANVNLHVFAGNSLSLEPVVYRAAKVKGNFYLLDRFRAFLNFVWATEKLLSVKRISKAWTINDYFGPYLALTSDYFKDFDVGDSP
jgi:hypothetical protein